MAGLTKITKNSIQGIDTSADATAITIDSSGNVLVGMTAVSGSTDGLHFRPGIASGINVTNDHTIALNRKSTDGEILRFLKDSSVVGSIGTKSGELVIGSGDTGVSFASGQDALIPKNTTTNANANNLLDLGIGSARWRNLYLGGSVYLGGTGSANALDDYEEGTFTPTLSASSCTFSYSNQAGYYTKIGRMVHYVIYLKGTGTGTTTNVVQITGLPFTSLNASLYEAPASTWNSVSAGDARPLVNTNNTSFSIYYAGTTSQAVVNDTQDKYLLLQGSYETN